jgi:hypothetical protein
MAALVEQVKEDRERNKDEHSIEEFLDHVSSFRTIGISL